jgi:hypothetical protein
MCNVRRLSVNDGLEVGGWKSGPSRVKGLIFFF